MDSDTMDMDSDTMGDTMADSDTTARGLLMLRPIPTFFMEDTLDTDTLDTPDTSDTMAMDSDTSTARGLLMLRLSLILTTGSVTDLDTPDTSDMPDSDTLDMPDTADTTSANRLHQDISVNHRQDFRQKWIVVSLKFPSPVLQFQCYHN